MTDTRRTLTQTLDDLLRRFDALVDWLDEHEHDDFDLVHSDGKLVLVFQNGQRIIINRQSGNDQIWVAEPRGGWHFDWTGEQWVCDKRGVELYASLNALISAIYGIEIELKNHS